MNRTYIRIAGILLSLCLTACSGFRHQDFSKQKYLNLKKGVYQNPDEEEPHRIEQNPDHFGESNTLISLEAKPESAFLLNNAESVDLVVSDEQKLTVSVDDFSGKRRTDDSTKVVVASNNKASAIELPTEPASRFDMIFQIGFMMIMLAVLFAAMALTASSALMLWFCIVAGGAALITAWIFSFLAIRTGKRVAVEERKKGFEFKNFLAYFVNVIGWIVVAANILLWGIVLLFSL